MKYTKVFLDAIAYELPPVVVSSASLEERLAPVYQALHIPKGQLEAWTGIRERRWWEPGFRLSEGATRAGRKALAKSGVPAGALGALVYAGVGRENFEPATACAVAHGLGLGEAAAVYDLSNACLGVVNAIQDIANRIELGQLRAGLIVSCESAREINDVMIERMLAERSMDFFKSSMATLTGGSGAVALVLTDGSFGSRRRRLVGGAHRAAPQHHGLCRWGMDLPSTEPPLPRSGNVALLSPARVQQMMETDAVAVLHNGVALGLRTWDALMGELGWSSPVVDRVIAHQVGSANRDKILQTIGVPKDRDFSTFEFLGNIGTVSLPLTAALAEERGVLQAGQKVAWLGIGSGLNCLMAGWEW